MPKVHLHVDRKPDNAQFHRPLHIFASKYYQYSHDTPPQNTARSLVTNYITYVHTKLNCGLSARANYTERANAACRRIYWQLLRIEGVEWSAQWFSTAVFSDFQTGAATFSFK
jgi:hypothetical protein